MCQSRFLNPLITKHLKGMQFELRKPFVYVVKFEPYETVNVPVGFVTDLASIPKIFWSIIGGPNGRYGKASVIHDWLYFKQTYSRRKSDLIFYEAMRELKVNFVKRWLIYHAVRVGAWIPWGRHKRSLNK